MKVLSLINFFKNSTLYVLRSKTRQFSTLRLRGRLSAWYGVQIGTIAIVLCHDKEAV